MKELHRKYITENPTLAVSYGTFLALKPFYVQSATTKDMEMCCCKKHLHARWFINALISCCQKQNINLEFYDYCSFFEFLTSECEKEDNTYISWNCTPEKKRTCRHINVRWAELRERLKNIDDRETTVPLQHFEKQYYTKKNGKNTTQLKAVSTAANMEFITEFLSNFLPKLIHHRNQLKH